MRLRGTRTGFASLPHPDYIEQSLVGKETPGMCTPGPAPRCSLSAAAEAVRGGESSFRAPRDPVSRVAAALLPTLLLALCDHIVYNIVA